jgi:hypothetical protein
MILVHFVITDMIFRMWIRITKPSLLICGRVNLPTKREIKHQYDIKNKELQINKILFCLLF